MELKDLLKIAFVPKPIDGNKQTQHYVLNKRQIVIFAVLFILVAAVSYLMGNSNIGNTENRINTQQAQDNSLLGESSLEDSGMVTRNSDENLEPLQPGDFYIKRVSVVIKENGKQLPASALVLKNLKFEAEDHVIVGEIKSNTVTAYVEGTVYGSKKFLGTFYAPVSPGQESAFRVSGGELSENSELSFVILLDTK